MTPDRRQQNLERDTRLLAKWERRLGTALAKVQKYRAAVKRHEKAAGGPVAVSVQSRAMREIARAAFTDLIDGEIP